MNDDIDWCDNVAVEKLNKRRTQKLRAIVKRRVEARENNDKTAFKKATTELAKHRIQEELYERKAKEAGNKWI